MSGHVWYAMIVLASLPASADPMKTCLAIDTWKFQVAGSSLEVQVRAGMSLTDPSQSIPSAEGTYRNAFDSNVLRKFNNPSLYVPAIGGLRAIEAGGQKAVLPAGDYAGVGPVFGIPKVGPGATMVAISVAGDRSSYAGMWKASPVLCEDEEALRRQAHDELWQRSLPSAMAVLCAGLSGLFWAIYRYTSKRFQVYRHFSWSLLSWTIFFSVLAGWLRQVSYAVGTAALFPSRVIASLGLLFLFYAYRDKPFRRIDTSSIYASGALVVLAVAFGISGNTAGQVACLGLSTLTQFPVAFDLISNVRVSKRKTFIASIMCITIAGELLDYLKLVGWNVLPIPYLARLTLPPTLLCSAAYFLWHFVSYYRESRLNDFRHRALGRLALYLSQATLTPHVIIRLARAARWIMFSTRATLATKTSSGEYVIQGAGGVNPEAIGEKLKIETYSHLKAAVTNGELSVAVLPVRDRKRYQDGFSLVVPLPLQPNPEYLLLLSNIKRGYQFNDSAMNICRQFFVALSGAISATQERARAEKEEKEKQALIQKIDPYLYDFINRNIDGICTVDETCERGVVFFDQKGYTKLLERLHPDQAAQALQRIKQWVCGCALRYNARAAGFYGDAWIIEVYPLLGESVEDTATRTAHVAWDLCEGVDGLNHQLVESGLPPATFRFGATFGLAAQVSVDLTAGKTLIGDAVNLSQRIQDKAPPSSVLVIERIALAAADRFEFERWTKTAYVKNRSSLVILYRMIGKVERREKVS